MPVGAPESRDAAHPIVAKPLRVNSFWVYPKQVGVAAFFTRIFLETRKQTSAANAAADDIQPKGADLFGLNRR